MQPGENPAALAESLAASSPDAIFILLAGQPASSLIQATRGVDFKTRWLACGMLSGRALLSTPGNDLGDLYLAYPSLPGDLDPQGVELYRQLNQSHQLPTGHRPAQLAALAAAQLFVAAANQAGRGLTRGRLIEALESMYDFPTQVTRPVTYGPNRRRGIRGAHLVAASPEGDPPRWVGVD